MNKNQIVVERYSVVLLRHIEGGYTLVIPEKYINADNTQEAGSFTIRTEIIPDDLRSEQSKFAVIITSEIVDPDNEDRDLREICRKVEVERISEKE